PYWQNYIQYSGYSLEEFKQAELTNVVFYLLVLFLVLSEIFPKVSPLSRWLNRRNLQNNFVKQEPKQVLIFAETLTIASQSLRETRQWQDFDRIVENRKTFLLYYSRNNEYTIVPKHVFTTEAEIRYFRDRLNNK
ncbi:MAG: YcxB family protein, partial [Cyanobacteria bacterium J06631_6]